MRAPELQVPIWIDGEGEKRSPFKLDQHSGKWVFLKCFQNWCPGCHSSGFPTLKRLVQEYGPDHKKITFAAIQTTFEGHSTNNKDALRELQLRYDTPIPFGHDEGDPRLPNNNPKHYPNTMVSYKTRGTPWLVLITPTREVLYSNFHVNVEKLIEYLNPHLA